MNTLKMGLGLTALLVCVSLLLMGAAQDTKDTSRITRYGVTGCLQEGHQVNEYQLIAENAQWDLKSDDVRLADHVGHKVKVNGVVSNQPFHGMKEDLKAEVGKKPTETGVLTVTNLEWSATAAIRTHRSILLNDNPESRIVRRLIRRMVATSSPWNRANE